MTRPLEPRPTGRGNLRPGTTEGADPVDRPPRENTAHACHQLVCTGRPSLYPAELCTPTTARSVNSASVVAPA